MQISQFTDKTYVCARFTSNYHEIHLSYRSIFLVCFKVKLNFYPTVHMIYKMVMTRGVDKMLSLIRSMLVSFLQLYQEVYQYFNKMFSRKNYSNNFRLSIGTGVYYSLKNWVLNYKTLIRLVWEGTHDWSKPMYHWISMLFLFKKRKNKKKKNIYSFLRP